MFLIPDAVSLPAILAGLAAAGWAGADAGFDKLASHALAAILAAALFMAIRAFYGWWRGIEGIGLGDVKLAAAAGAWLGLEGLGPALLIACAGALLVVGVQSAARRQAVHGQMAIPFGTFIAPAVALTWLGQLWSS